MNTIDHIMALADEYMRWGGKDRDRQALRAAIEQALTPGEPYCYTYTENGEEFFAPPTAYVPDNAVPLYTAPQPQPKQEPAIIHREIVRIEPDGTETWRETPLYTAPQPQREWVGLTAEERARIAEESDTKFIAVMAAEIKLRERNGGVL